MEVRPVDPRDIEWETDLVAYRVYFWAGTTSDEYEITDAADIHAVIAWAEENAAGRTYTLYARLMNGDTPGLVQLSGVDPTQPN